MDISTVSRRDFLRRATALGIGTATCGTIACNSPGLVRPKGDTRLRVLSIGVVGSIGIHDRSQVAAHPQVDIVGLCDVDSNYLARAAKDHPNAFTCADYREAFDKYGDKFDAVIVATPDHSHCSIMTLALSRGKHVYGQKPLVHQLEELDLLARATAARPNLVTQTGAQRITSPFRRAAVDILKQGTLGKVIEAHITFGSRGALNKTHFFADGKLGDPIQPPTTLNHDLWLAGNQVEPLRPQQIPLKWRSWWQYGGGMIGDWIVHTSDVLFYAYPELTSPTQVCSRTPHKATQHFHASRVQSTLKYEVGQSKHFANTSCNFHFYDNDMYPDRKMLGLGEGDWPGGGICTVVVCEGGTMVLGPNGPLELWRDGQKTDGMKLEGLPEYPKFNHWHAWVDKCLGKDTPHHWAPFEQGLRCTEPGLLAVKAAMYPGQVLDWDRRSLTFTNHAEATKTLVRREYRQEFAPVRL